MGNFRFTIDAVGGHGCDRNAKPGDVLQHCDNEHCPDCAAARFVDTMKAQPGTVISAEFKHWPADTGCSGPEIVDDLLAGTRKSKSFQDPLPANAGGDEPIMRFFAYTHLPINLQEVSRPFHALATRVLHTTPRSAERSVALRKLLEAKDAAVRALLP